MNIFLAENTDTWGSLLTDPIGITVLVVFLFMASTSVLYFVMWVTYFFRRNKSEKDGRGFAESVFAGFNMPAQVTGGWIAIRFWNYKKRTKTLKLSKILVYSRKSMYAALEGSQQAYYAHLVESGDPRRFAIKFGLFVAPILFILGVASAILFVLGLTGVAEMPSQWIFGLAGTGLIVIALLLSVGSLVMIKRGLMKSLEGNVHEDDIKSIRFYLNVKIAFTIALLLWEALKLIVQIADKFENNKK